jgi:hypothetical protein
MQIKAWKPPHKIMQNLEDRVDLLEIEHRRLRLEYDRHLVFGKTGGMAAIAIFLVLIVALVLK